MGRVRRPRKDGLGEGTTAESQVHPRRTLAETKQTRNTDSPGLERFLPYSLRTRRTPGQNTRDAGSDAEGPPLEDSADFAQVGSHIASVLAAAEHAAEQISEEAREAASKIREDASREAERIRREADDVASACERQRAEIEKYVAETREAADAYAQKTRQTGEAEAEKIRADAEKTARSVVGEAERRGQDIEDAARRRSEHLAKEEHDIEERMRNLLGASRELTEHLEEELGLKSSPEAAAGQESLDEALKPATGRGASRKKSSRASAKTSRGQRTR